MFCYQCEQTAKGEGCTKIGVCGKQSDVAALQDLLNYVVKGLSQLAVEGRGRHIDRAVRLLGRGDTDPMVVDDRTDKHGAKTFQRLDFSPSRA